MKTRPIYLSTFLQNSVVLFLITPKSLCSPREWAVSCPLSVARCINSMGNGARAWGKNDNSMHQTVNQVYPQRTTDYKQRTGLSLIVSLRLAFLSNHLSPCFPLLYAKLNPLSQWHIPGPVDCAGLSPHVGFPGIGAGFPATACVLLSAKSAADFGA